MTMTPVIFTDKPVMDRHFTGFGLKFEQIRILMPVHGPALVFEPHIPAVWQETTEHLPPVLYMAPQYRKRIGVTALRKAADVF